LSGQTATVDFNGNLNLGASGKGCVPGTYTIEGSEATAPYQTFAATLTIDPPTRA
jgi:hypothetical protein